jgi:hypothetical protein
VEDASDYSASLGSDKIGEFAIFDDDIIKLVSEFNGRGVVLH